MSPLPQEPYKDPNTKPSNSPRPFSLSDIALTELPKTQHTRHRTKKTQKNKTLQTQKSRTQCTLKKSESQKDPQTLQTNSLTLDTNIQKLERKNLETFPHSKTLQTRTLNTDRQEENQTLWGPKNPKLKT